MRSIPSGVRGPVEGPPCIRHRPLGIAGPLQGVPLRVLAPQRGALSGFPGLLLFLSQPRPARRAAWGLPAISSPPPGFAPPGLNIAGDHGLTTWTDCDMLVDHLYGLFPAAPDSIEGQ